MQINNINIIKAIAELKNLAGQHNPSFPDALCEFLIEQFQLQSAIIFNINENDSLFLCGKSSTVKKSFQLNSVYECNHCKLIKPEAENFSFFNDSACEIKSTDYIIYEGCILLKTPANTRYILRISQKTPFTQLDREGLQNVAKLVLQLLNDWKSQVTSGTNFSSFITRFSNEFRAPANSVLGFTSLLADDKLTSMQTEYVKSLKENAQKLTSVINDIIDYAKIETGIISTNNVSTNVSDFVNEIVTSFRIKTAKDTVTYEVLLDQSIPGSLSIDNEKLKYVFNSILSFFAKKLEAGSIKITSSFDKNNKLNFNISENTLVIPREKLSDFYQVTTTTDSQKDKTTDGTHLGIMLSRKYVNLLGGELDISSALNKGTVITFSVKTEKSTDIESKISQLPQIPGKNKVLVIEDDYATSKLLSNYLNKWKYEPTIVNSGKKALELLEQEQFLAIITDIILPDINGLEMLKKIRENKKTRNTPIIVCSVEAEQQKAYMMGAVEYFVKPIKYKDLVEVITSYKLKKDSNILCVDDDVPTLNLIKEAIESVGFNAIAESRSTRVMNLIENIHLDLAIVDLDMPEINGFQLIKLIKSNPKFANLPIIIYTGKENFDEDLKSIDGLFTELFSKKSANIEDLAGTISKMINQYEEPSTPEEAAKNIDVPSILLVEDYKHSQIIVTRLLKKNNFTTVVVVENGAEAVDLVKKQNFDLILMDMQMPVMNGFEATERIRQMPEYKDTPIIALTAFAMKGDREKCLEAGATDYIPKPIDSQEFIEKVRFYTSDKFKVK
ncbi:MAG TPA: response regulator [Ignavibacteriaceae bacterium]|nr:response regulator [Ignavibacteriaceae bacterium]